MAEVAKVLEFASARAPARHKAEWHARSEPARLIPGSSAATWHGAFRGYGYPQPDGFLASAWTKLIETVLRPLQLIHPSELGVALSDLAIMAILLMCVERMSRMALGFLGFYLLLFVVSAAETGLYRKRHHSLTAQILALANALLWTAILAYLMGTRIPGSLGLASLSVVTFASTCSLSLTRLVWKTLKISPGSARNVLVIADSRIARKVLDKLQSGFDSDICVKAFLPVHCLSGGYDAEIVRTLARQECVDEVIIGTTNLELAQSVVETARQSQLCATIALDFPRMPPTPVESLADLNLLRVHDQPLPQWRLAFKRTTDVMLAFCALLVMSPLLLVIAAVVKLDSAGPVFYRSNRIGQRGRSFICYKFRTMLENADEEKEKLRSRNERQGAFFKILNDPRITRIGRFLRRYSLDELPQLWNVVRGEMSLVGPRPHPPDDVAGYSDEHLQRLDFIPGMTGLWQVTARQDPSFERCVALDIEYIKRWSPALDFRILCKTVMAVLQGSGA